MDKKRATILRDQEKLIDYLDRTPGGVDITAFMKSTLVSEKKAKFILNNYGFQQIEINKPGYQRVNPPDPHRYGRYFV